jgi:hypothetical protein
VVFFLLVILLCTLLDYYVSLNVVLMFCLFICLFVCCCRWGIGVWILCDPYPCNKLSHATVKSPILALHYHVIFDGSPLIIADPVAIDKFDRFLRTRVHQEILSEGDCIIQNLSFGSQTANSPLTLTTQERLE